MTGLRAAIIAAVLLSTLVVTHARAQEVTLTARSGDSAIAGRLLGYDGDYYRIETPEGELSVDAARVRCSGDCPDLENHVEETRFSGAASMGRVLLPALVEGFALREGLALRREGTSPGEFTYVLAERDDGADIARFRFRLTSSEEGFADLLANEADLVMSLREIRPGEARRARQAGLGNLAGPGRVRVLGRDALVLAVAPGQGGARVDLASLGALLSGRVTDWKELGLSSEGPVELHLPGAGTGAAQLVEDLLLRPAGLRIAANARRHDDGPSLAQAVATGRGTLGLVLLSEIGNAAAVDLRTACGNSLSPGRREIATGDYPLTVPLYLYQPMLRLPRTARAFLAYTRSPAAQLVVRRAGFIDQLPEEIALDAQGARLAAALQRAEGEAGLYEVQRLARRMARAPRQAPTFRYRAQGDDLDAPSLAALDQLARAVIDGQYDRRRLVFTGFAPAETSDEGATAAEEAALARGERLAGALRDALRARLLAAGAMPGEMAVESFGAAMPITCDDGALGDHLDRRVELWAEPVTTDPRHGN